MAVNWGSLIFGGVDSSEYGIYLSGEGVYNAPERAVEMVDVPGRNGAVIIDQGHWNNIEVVYHAGVYGVNQAEMSEKLSAFRNAILSQVGYQRLSDSYHPEEYRMGAYVSGLEVSPASYNRHGEFDLVFNCKPQRWMIDGDLPIPVDNGDVLENPTLFQSSPLLHLTGSGTIEFNGYEIDIAASEPWGEIPLTSGNLDFVQYDSDVGYIGGTFQQQVDFDGSRLLPGDPIYLTNNISTDSRIFCEFQLMPKTPAASSGVSFSNVSSGLNVYRPDQSSYKVAVWFDKDIVNFEYGTESEYTGQFTVSGTVQGVSYSYTVYITVLYWGADSFTIMMNYGNTSGTDQYWDLSKSYKALMIHAPILGDSSLLTALDVFIDCEIGEAYKENAGSYVSVNSIIDLGSDLPKLAPGSNKISFDNTFSEVYITPRWWKL